jgi:hypothetical protein
MPEEKLRFDQILERIRNPRSSRAFGIRSSGVRIHGGHWLPGVGQTKNF